MKRLAALAICTLAFGAACSRTSVAPAATINGTKISTTELVDELNAIEGNPDYIASLQHGAPDQSGQPTTGLVSVQGSTPGSFDAAFVSQLLRRDLVYALIHAEVARRHLVIDDACRVEARDDVVKNLGNNDAAAGQRFFDKFPKRYQDLLVQRDAELFVLDASLSGQKCGGGPDAAGYYNAHPADFTQLCLSLITVNDQATADSVVAQLRGGADFATLAQQVSTDAQTKDAGGVYGCHFPSAFPPSVAAVLQAGKTGDVLDPIPTQTGMAVVKITDRQLAPLSDVQQQAEELASANVLKSIGPWLQQVRADAKVTVDARYGTFDPSTFNITAPALDANSSSPGSSSSPLSSSTDSP